MGKSFEATITYSFRGNQNSDTIGVWAKDLADAEREARTYARENYMRDAEVLSVKVKSVKKSR
jgi:hypothetical protein